MTKPNEVAENLKRALSEVTRIRNGELPKRPARGMVDRIRKKIAEDDRR